MSIFQLLFATSSVADTGFEGLNFSAAGDSFTLADGGSGTRRAFCLGREADYSYTSPNVIWASVSSTAFAKFELQSGTFTKVGSNINSGMNVMDMTDTGTHIILVSYQGDVNRYNKSTGSLETETDDNVNRRGVVWKSPFFYTGSFNDRDSIDVFSTQASHTTYQNIVSSTNNSRKGLAYDPEDDLFYQCFDNGGGTIFSTTNSSSNTNSVSFTNEGTLPSWTDRGNLFSFDILKNSNGKFIIGKIINTGQIWCLYQLASSGSGGGGGGGSSSAGHQIFTSPGSNTFTVPSGVTSVCVVCIGGGGSGGAAYWSGGGGGGGGLGWKNNISVTPGNNYTVVVGSGGVGQTANSGGTGSSGGASYFISAGTVRGIGGTRGVGSSSTNRGPYAGGAGGSYTGDGGGNGGTGGTSNNDRAGGGGGAGGYSGNGGSGGTNNGVGSAGAGGAAGGGGSRQNNSSTGTAGSGGGVGLYGSGSNGSGGSASGGGGSGGSGGNNGSNGGTNNGDGASPGGGGGGQSNDSQNTRGGNGGNGAVRIIWGSGRSFPSTNVSSETG